MRKIAALVTTAAWSWEGQIRRLIITLLAMAAASCASPRRYDLAMDLSFGQERVASPRFYVQEGKRASVRIDDLFVDVVATDAPEISGIRLSFSVGRVEDGRRIPMASPTIVASPGQRAEVRVTPATNNAAVVPLMLAVTAQQRSR